MSAETCFSPQRTEVKKRFCELDVAGRRALLTIDDERIVGRVYSAVQNLATLPITYSACFVYLPSMRRMPMFASLSLKRSHSMSGANAVYSLVAASHWGWRMVGTEALSRTASAAALRVLQTLQTRILKFAFLETTNNFALLNL